MFWSKNNKNVYPCITQFYYIKVVYKGIYLSRTCYPDVLTNNQVVGQIFLGCVLTMFWSKNNKNVYPCIPQFYYIKVVYKGIYLSRTCYPDVLTNNQVVGQIFLGCALTIYVLEQK